MFFKFFRFMSEGRWSPQRSLSKRHKAPMVLSGGLFMHKTTLKLLKSELVPGIGQTLILLYYAAVIADSVVCIRTYLYIHISVNRQAETGGNCSGVWLECNRIICIFN